MGYKFTNKEEFKEEFKTRIEARYGRSLEQSHVTEQYMILGNMIRDYVAFNWKASKQEIAKKQEKQMFYFSMEFLMGRLLTNNLMNLGIYGMVKDGLADLGIDINELENQESDAGLGNGGLGRLAACFLDSLASTGYAGHGNCIRFEYGLFKQKIVDGKQVEVPDQWLNLGNVWEVRKPKHAVNVKFYGNVQMEADGFGKMKAVHVGAQVIRAVPYDVEIIGHDTKLTNTLRLWSAEPAGDAIDSHDFSKYIRDVAAINQTLYPDDSTEEGKYLRLKQSYFFVSAGLTAMVKAHLRTYDTLDNFAEKNAIQLNDTHPVLAIPELMRILMDDLYLGWDEAWDIVTRTVAYTNHTVMAEALETWNEDLLHRILPRIYQIILEINRRFMADVWNLYPGEWERINKLSLIGDNHVRMANLSVHASHCVNGVSALHSDIIKRSIFKEFYTLTPDKFTNVTNGIAHRRWLHQSNPRLSNLLDETIGHGWYSDASELKKFRVYENDENVLNALADIKYQNKVDFANRLYKKQGVLIDPKTRFDVQVKRLHAYKRQLLNVLKIINLYNILVENPNADITPQTYIFGAKAAPGYYHAKEVIELINYIAKDISMHPEIKAKLNVAFIEDYCVSTAECLMPASEISEQISLAGKEASGTGNMKFMINGAVTFGTMDGANVEICDSVGNDNIFIFGMTTKEVDDLWAKGYNSTYYYNNSMELRKIIDRLKKGFAGKSFENIATYLLTSGGIADQYMCLADYENYFEVYKQMDKVYKNKLQFQKMSLVNISEAGRFAADRSIEDYARDIWHLKKLK